MAVWSILQNFGPREERGDSGRLDEFGVLLQPLEQHARERNQ